MSRTIKFRVYDKKEKRYREDGMIYFFDIIQRKVKAYYQRFFIEQYTGLKDKNGKEIYEGDILQIDDHILGDFVVVWHNFGWKIKRSVGYESLSVHKSEDCTVIGNIHENPELLGGEE